MSDNMRIYQVARKVPEGAVKAIKGGAYGAAGLSDINPQWRIECMTQICGPIGEGWMWEPVKLWEENGVCYAQMAVKYRMNSGEWSEPVYGFGGTKIGGKDDSDLYKSTITDALGNALRYLGVGADVWFKSDSDKNQFDSKYSAPPETAERRRSAPAKPPAQKPADAPRMAAPGQKQFIIDNATDEQYQSAMEAYGAELEKLTFAVAEKLIAKIQRNAG